MYIAVMRHGEAEHNVQKRFDSSIMSTKKLTKEGIAKTINTAEQLCDILKEKNEIFHTIYSSPLLRTYQTSMQVRNVLEHNKRIYPKGRIILDFNLRESEMGTFDGKHSKYYPYPDWDFSHNDEFGGETEKDVMNRMHKFITTTDIFENILIITHGTPMKCLLQILLPDEKVFKTFRPDKSKCVIVDFTDKSFKFTK